MLQHGRNPRVTTLCSDFRWAERGDTGASRCCGAAAYLLRWTRPALPLQPQTRSTSRSTSRCTSLSILLTLPLHLPLPLHLSRSFLWVTAAVTHKRLDKPGVAGGGREMQRAPSMLVYDIQVRAAAPMCEHGRKHSPAPLHETKLEIGQ